MRGRRLLVRSRPQLLRMSSVGLRTEYGVADASPRSTCFQTDDRWDSRSSEKSPAAWRTSRWFRTAGTLSRSQQTASFTERIHEHLLRDRPHIYNYSEIEGQLTPIFNSPSVRPTLSAHCVGKQLYIKYINCNKTAHKVVGQCETWRHSSHSDGRL